jgi:hypothetical protein
MKNQKRIPSLFVCFFIVLVTTGCDLSNTRHSSSSTPNVTGTLSEFMISSTPTGDHFKMYTPSPYPTMPINQEKLLNEKLHDINCNLPCYLGITPGKTKIDEAIRKLEDLGGIYDGVYLRESDGAQFFSFTMKIGDPAAWNETPDPDGSSMEIYNDVSLITDNDIVQIVDVAITASKSISKFREYWSHYSVKEIFMQLGKPESFYIDVIDPELLIYGRNLILVYEKSNTEIEFYGPGKDNHLCPNNDARYIFLHLELSYENSTINISNDGRVPLTDREVYLPIEEALRVNEDEFYNRVLSDPDVCFEIDR